MKQSLRATARTLDAGEAVRRVPAIEEPVHYTLRCAAQRTAGVLKALLIGADKVLPVVAEDLVERIISKDAGTVSHGVYPADVKQAFQAAAGQDRCRGMGKGRLQLISGFRRAAYGTETRIGDMAKGCRDCKRGCQSRTPRTESSFAGSLYEPARPLRLVEFPFRPLGASLVSDHSSHPGFERSRS